MDHSSQHRNALAGSISSFGRKIPLVGDEQLYIQRARGPHLWDSHNRRYIDLVMGFGSVMLGHSSERVNGNLISALEKGSMPGFSHLKEEEAARILTERTKPLNKAVFVNSGSESVQLAFKVAREYSGKRRVVAFLGSYHGWHIGQQGFSELPSVINDSLYIDASHELSFALWNNISSLEHIISNRDDIAAIVLEPVMANAGCLLPDKDFLSAIQHLARENNILIIADEVLMGFRVHAGLTSTLLGISPDLATLGKAIGNGFPVAALVGTDKIMSAIDSGRISTAGTYNGNPLACAAVISTILELEKENYNEICQKASILRETIESHPRCRGRLLTTGLGGVFSIWYSSKVPHDYLECRELRRDDLALKLHLLLRQRGVMTMPSSFGRCFLSFTHDEKTIEELRQRMFAALDELSHEELWET